MSLSTSGANILSDFKLIVCLFSHCMVSVVHKSDPLNSFAIRGSMHMVLWTFSFCVDKQPEDPTEQTQQYI